MLSEQALPTAELRIPLDGLDAAADALVGCVEGVESPALARQILAAWLRGAVDQLVADAATYATSPQRGFATRAFAEALAQHQST